MKRAIALIAGSLLATACSSTSPDPVPVAAPPPAAAAPAPIAAAPAAPADQCGLAEARALVGRNRSEIPVPVDPALQRVACTTCPVTLDFSPKRLNFFFDAATGVIREVRCG